VRISVLIACYNAGGTLAKTLDSLLEQTLPADEIIVVDDGSSDTSAEVAAAYKDQGVVLIRQVNMGASKARNSAFSASRGQFVIFVDADDLVGPKHLEALFERLRCEPRCVALSKWGRFYHSLDETEFPNRTTEADMTPADWLIESWRNARPMTQSGMLLLPRALIEENGGWDERLTLIDDFEFFARIIARSDGIRFAPEGRLYYRSGIPGSLSRKQGLDAVKSEYLSLTLGVQSLLDLELTPRAKLASANVLQDFDFKHYPAYPELRAKIRARVRELGGSDLEPDGAPGFHTLRRIVGWRVARLIQKSVERLRSVCNGLTRQQSEGTQ
jgi:glycosyltransferase involved in cell wall biosynthesis